MPRVISQTENSCQLSQCATLLSCSTLTIPYFVLRRYLKASFPAKAFTAIVQFSDGRLSNADTDLKQIEELLGQATCPCHRIGVGGHGEETTVPKERVGVSTVQTHASRGQNQVTARLSLQEKKNLLQSIRALEGFSRKLIRFRVSILNRIKPLKCCQCKFDVNVVPCFERLAAETETVWICSLTSVHIGRYFR